MTNSLLYQYVREPLFNRPCLSLKSLVRLALIVWQKNLLYADHSATAYIPCVYEVGFISWVLHDNMKGIDYILNGVKNSKEIM